MSRENTKQETINQKVKKGRRIFKFIKRIIPILILIWLVSIIFVIYKDDTADQDEEQTFKEWQEDGGLENYGNEEE